MFCTQLLQLWFCSHLQHFHRLQTPYHFERHTVSQTVQIALPFTGDSRAWALYLLDLPLSHYPSLALRQFSGVQYPPRLGDLDAVTFDYIPGEDMWRLLLRIEDIWGAYLGGNVCAEILSGPLQFGPRAKTLRQEVHFSYHMQLSDHQELLRSSRNLSQKMTPWHKERSNGLRSQDHILRTQARLCARPVPLENRVFLTRNKLIHKPGCVGKKTHSCTTWNSRIAKILSGRVRNPDRKTALKRTKNTPVASGRGTISHKSKLGFPRIRNLARVGNASFPTVPRTSKSDIGS
uniref:Uncharacterized protein n=1 Tax=Fagus sylvatica TaxID=28930 RepID=A0A2N9GFV1_FAGSY